MLTGLLAAMAVPKGKTRVLPLAETVAPVFPLTTASVPLKS